MTVNELRNKSFDKGAFGYKAEEVHLFLNEMADYLETLERQNMELEGKITTLNNQLAEYTNNEDSMKDIIVSAQRISTTVVQEAKEKAQQIVSEAQIKSSSIVSEATMKSAKMLKEAEAKAESMVAQSRDQAEIEKHRLDTMQKEVSKFKSNLLSIYKAHLDLITKLPEVKPEAAQQQERPRRAERTVEQSPESAPAEKPREKKAEAADKPTAADFGGTTPFKIVITEKDSPKAKSERSDFKSRFGELKFGESQK